jgi:hypothetical protein
MLVLVMSFVCFVGVVSSNSNSNMGELSFHHISMTLD